MPVLKVQENRREADATQEDKTGFSEEIIQQTDKITINSETTSALCKRKRRLARIQET